MMFIFSPLKENLTQRIIFNKEHLSITAFPVFKKYMKKNITLAVILALTIIGVIIAFFVFNQNKKEGYYTYGKNCSSDSDCICEGISGGVDACGKPGQLPACVNGKCGFNNYE